MVHAMAAADPPRYWQGEYFFAFRQEASPEGDASMTFRADDAGVTFVFGTADWANIHRLLTRAWDRSDLARQWETLTLEYGTA
jgi:hypothetical protein